MIIFGISNSQRSGEAVPGPCEHCSEHARVGVRRFRYFHLFWLPVIPLGAADVSVCTHCKAVVDKVDMAEDFKRRVRDTNAQLKRPLWHFAGTSLVVGLILFNMNADRENQLAAAAAAAQPHVGDIWIIDAEDTFPQAGYPYRYTAGRVTAVVGDEIAIALSDWSYAVSAGARKDIHKAIEGKDAAYFGDAAYFAVDELVAYQASEDFRLYNGL